MALTTFRIYNTDVKNLSAYEFPSADIALITGSGYSIDKNQMVECGFVPYLDFFPVCTNAIFSDETGGRYFKLPDGRILLVFEKRIHPYQGFSASDSVLPVKIAKASNVETIFLANSAGGLNPQITTGDFVVIRNLVTLPSAPDFSPDFDSDEISKINSPFDSELSDVLFNIVKEIHGSSKDGTYAYKPGPAYETRAEVDFLISLGADVVGMSTAYEALFAHLSGIKAVGLSLVTNVHYSETQDKISHKEVLDEASKAKSDINEIILKFVE